MSEQRRLSVSSHPPRKRGTPAYQVRRSQRLTTAATDHAASEPAEPIASDIPEVAETPPIPAPNSHNATGTEALPVVEPTAEQPIAAGVVDATSEPVIETPDAVASTSDEVTPEAVEDESLGSASETTSEETEPEQTANAPLVEPAPTSGAEDVATPSNEIVPEQESETDYADYARSVEEAAARSRLEMAPQAAATAVYPAIPPASVAQVTTASPTVRGRRGRPVVGSRVRGNGNGGGGGRGRTRHGNREPDPRPMLKRPKTWFVIIGIIIAIVGIAAVLWAANIARVTYKAYNEAHVEAPDRTIYTVNPQGTPVAVPTEQVQASLPNWDNQDPFNVLLMGIDDRDGDSEPPRTDTMIVVRVNPATNHVVMMSIPRDLLVYIPIADRWDKMNAAFPIGEEQGGDQGGPAAVMETIEANFDVRIHYFVTVDFDGFRTIVDTVGGVIIDVKAPIKDDQYPTEDFGITREYFATGLQKMDGENALRYARTRHNDNDIARSDRQQQMLVALREQAVDLGLITKAEELIRQMGSMVKTDFNFNQLLALANLGRNVDPNGISKVNLWDAGVLSEHFPEDEFDPFYFEADWPAVLDLMTTYFENASTDPVPPTPTGAVPDQQSTSSGSATTSSPRLDTPIIVQNDADIPMLASVVSQIMNDAGFSIVSPETGVEVRSETVIYDYAERPETARYIASQLGLDESSIVYGNGGNGIVIALGTDLAWVLD